MKMQANCDVRQLAKNRKVFWWQVAAVLGVTESTVIRWLRVDLSPDKKQRIIDAIERVAWGGENR